jgi:hypothetical protein
MDWMRSRLARIPKFGRVVIGLVIGSVALVTATSYWQNRLGYRGIGVIGVAGLIALVGVVVLPDRAWARVTGIDTLAVELGQLHAEGALLRSRLPWEPDASHVRFPAWAAEIDAWDARVQARLQDTQWLGTYLSPLGRITTTTAGSLTASQYRNGTDDRLERLAQIIAALGRHA